MKVAEILEERSAFKDFDDIFEYLLNASGITSMIKTPLYRGMGYVDNHDKIQSTGARGGGHSDLLHSSAPQFHKYYDKWMTEKFGYPYLSQGIFTTGDKALAEDYGDLFLVFPIGKFKFVWSPKVGDQVDIQHAISSGNPNHEYSYEEFAEYMDTWGYTDQNLQAAVDSGHEIILHCDKYFHIGMDTIREWGGDYNSLEELWADLKG